MLFLGWEPWGPNQTVFPFYLSEFSFGSFMHYFRAYKGREEHEKYITHGLATHYLEFHFLVIYSVSECIILYRFLHCSKYYVVYYTYYFIILIILYMYIIYHSPTMSSFFSSRLENFPAINSLFSPYYNIIIILIISTYFENHLRQYFNFFFSS